MEGRKQNFHLMDGISKKITALHLESLNKDDFVALLKQNEADCLTTVPKNFACLPNEVIYDVIAVATEKRVCKAPDLGIIMKIEGSWGEIAQETVERLNSLFTYQSSYFYDNCQRQRPFPHARNNLICYALIDKTVNIQELRAIVSNLYNWIQFENVPNIPSDILTRLGTRFAVVEWYVAAGEPAETLLKPEVINFVKRQLRSQYLRQLNVCGLGFKPNELDDLLVDFVKRPSFRFVGFYECGERATKEGVVGGYPMPAKAITEAYETWLSTKHYVVNRQQISASITKETYDTIREYFGTTCSPRSAGLHLAKCHDAHKDAKMDLTVSKTRNRFFLDFTFCSYGCE